jgi:hypothetical protein
VATSAGGVMARYAEGTTVPVESSRGEITGILAKHGCNRMAWGTAPEGDTLQFELKGNVYRFTIAHPSSDPKPHAWFNPNSRLQTHEQAAKEWRRRWRAHVLLIKAKLEFAAGGDTTLEREFMPNLLVEGGRRTLSEWLSDAQGGQMLLGSGER